jgi:hypothetical protein
VLGWYEAETRPTLPPEHARQPIEFIEGEMGKWASRRSTLMEKLIGRL